MRGKLRGYGYLTVAGHDGLVHAYRGSEHLGDLAKTLACTLRVDEGEGFGYFTQAPDDDLTCLECILIVCGEYERVSPLPRRSK